MNNLQSRKEKDKRLEDLIHNQIIESLNAIGEEMDWLEDQIRTEEKAIQQNNTEIDFIRTLDEDNIMGADGAPRSDVQAFLKKHGYNNTDDLALDEIQLIMQTIETDLHSDNIVRADRIEGYQERHGVLRKHSKQIAENATGAAKEQAQDLAARETPQVNLKAALKITDSVISAELDSMANEQRQEVETDGFSPPAL